MLKGASDAVPGIDRRDGPEGHCQEGGLKKVARSWVADEDSGVLKVLLKKRAAAIGRCKIALQQDEWAMLGRRGEDVKTGLKVADAAHADGPKDVGGVIDEAFCEVIDAPDFDAALRVGLKDAKAASEDGVALR